MIKIGDAYGKTFYFDKNKKKLVFMMNGKYVNYTDADNLKEAVSVFEHRVGKMASLDTAEEIPDTWVVDSSPLIKVPYYIIRQRVVNGLVIPQGAQK